MTTALVVIADGSEEMEAIISIDVLRRGGVSVTVAGLVSADVVKCSRDVMIKPECTLDSVMGKEFDAVVLPGGGPGSHSFASSKVIGQLLTDQEKKEKIIACICAAPIALSSHNIAKGKKLTSHPAVETRMREAGYNYSEERVVVDGKLVTSRGPGTAFEFALALVELLEGAAKREEIIPPMLLKV